MSLNRGPGRGGVTYRVTGDGLRLGGGHGQRGALGLAVEVIHPVLQVLLVMTGHLDPLDHGPCSVEDRH